jgi:hypothetical protein
VTTLQDPEPTVTPTVLEPNWAALSERLVAEFPSFAASDVITEIVQARDAAAYVGTAREELTDIVEFMATYALRVRLGEVTPSDRLDPERHASPRQRTGS